MVPVSDSRLMQLKEDAVKIFAIVVLYGTSAIVFTATPMAFFAIYLLDDRARLRTVMTNGSR